MPLCISDSYLYSGYPLATVLLFLCVPLFVLSQVHGRAFHSADARRGLQHPICICAILLDTLSTHPLLSQLFWNCVYPICTCIYIYVYIYIYIYMCVCVCVYKLIYVCMYIYVCACVCVHTHTYIYNVSLYFFFLRYTDEPFTALTPDAVFNIARFLLSWLLKEEAPFGISKT